MENKTTNRFGENIPQDASYNIDQRDKDLGIQLKDLIPGYGLVRYHRRQQGDLTDEQGKFATKRIIGLLMLNQSVYLPILMTSPRIIGGLLELINQVQL
jgi:hypothetical protein